MRESLPSHGSSHSTGLHGQVPPTLCESVDRNGTRSRREGKGTFPMITSQATHEGNLTNLAIFLVAKNGEIGKEVSSFDKQTLRLEGVN